MIEMPAEDFDQKQPQRAKWIETSDQAGAESLLFSELTAPCLRCGVCPRSPEKRNNGAFRLLFFLQPLQLLAWGGDLPAAGAGRADFVPVF